jgi:acyl-CoA thioester hydrolase
VSGAVEPRRSAPAHRTEIAVRFREVDSYGVVWHGHYLDWMETARHAYAGACGLDIADFQRRGLRFPMLECRVDYRNAAKLGDSIAIDVRLADEPRRAIAFDYALARSADGLLLARARTVQVVQGDDGGLLLRWPPELEQVLAAMRAFQGSLAAPTT